MKMILYVALFLMGCQSQMNWENRFLLKGREALDHKNYSEAEFYLEEILKTGYKFQLEASESLNRLDRLKKKEAKRKELLEKAVEEDSRDPRIIKLDEFTISKVQLKNCSLKAFLKKCRAWLAEVLDESERFSIVLQIPQTYLAVCRTFKVDNWMGHGA